MSCCIRQLIVSVRSLFAVLMTVFAVQGCVQGEIHRETYQFGVALRDQPVGGFLQNIFQNDVLGSILVIESLTIATNGGFPYHQTNSYFFHAVPPQSLVSAWKSIQGSDSESTIKYEFDRSDVETSDSFLFADLLLGADNNLVPNSIHTYKRLGREMDGIVETEWKVLLDTDVARHSKKSTQNTIIVDAQGRIQRIKTGGIEYVRLEGNDDYQAWLNSVRPPFETPLEVPVIGAIADPRNVASLRLKFNSKETSGSEWDPYLDSERVFDSTTFGKNRRSDAVHTRFPLVIGEVLDQQLKSLADQIQVSGSPLDTAHSMVNLVNEFLDYKDLDHSPKLAEILQTRQGDCTEFAELYQVLSGYVGLKSNIVYGLVYESSSHSFRPHAWNEVEIDGSWVGLDPTFNQTILDATHIPFPNGQHAALINDLFQTEFHVLEVRNRS